MDFNGMPLSLNDLLSLQSNRSTPTVDPYFTSDSEFSTTSTRSYPPSNSSSPSQGAPCTFTPSPLPTTHNFPNGIPPELIKQWVEQQRLHAQSQPTLQPPRSTFLRPTTGSSASPSTAPSKKPARIPRPPNAFMLFRSDFLRQGRVPQTETRKQQDLSKIAGEIWNMMGDAEKEVWREKARETLAAHAAKYPAYKFTPAPRASRGKGKGRDVGTESNGKDRIQEIRERYFKEYPGKAPPPARRRRSQRREGEAPDSRTELECVPGSLPRDVPPVWPTSQEFFSALGLPCPPEWPTHPRVPRTPAIPPFEAPLLPPYQQHQQQAQMQQSQAKSRPVSTNPFAPKMDAFPFQEDTAGLMFAQNNLFMPSALGALPDFDATPIAATFQGISQPPQAPAGTPNAGSLDLPEGFNTFSPQPQPQPPRSSQLALALDNLDPRAQWSEARAQSSWTSSQELVNWPAWDPTPVWPIESQPQSQDLDFEQWLQQGIEYASSGTDVETDQFLTGFSPRVSEPVLADAGKEDVEGGKGEGAEVKGEVSAPVNSTEEGTEQGSAVL